MAGFNHWMRFNIGDYLADTMHLTTFQHGLYVLLIMHTFKRGELPSDDAALARIGKCQVRQWKRHGGPVLALFYVAENGALRHRRIDAERAHARALSEKRADAGKAGASRRWDMANAMHDSRDRGDARATPENQEPNIPPDPPKGGRRGRDRSNGNGKDSRNAWIDLAAEDLDAHESDPRPEGARVVDLTGRLGRR